MKYFDPRTIFLARHAQHIVLVHFPIALLVASVVFDLLARWMGRDSLAEAAAWNLYAAAVTSPLAAFTGLLAWRVQLEGARLKGALLLHLCGAAIVVLFTCVLAWFRLGHKPDSRAPLPLAFHFAGVLAVVAVGVTAHLGGIVSGVVTLGG